MRILFPKEAETWLFPNLPQNTLIIGEQIENYLYRLLALGNKTTADTRITVLVEKQAFINTIIEKLKKDFPKSNLNVVIAAKTELPFLSNSFDRIYLGHDQFDDLSEQIFSEYARILKNHGNLFLYSLARCDSVPWVKRLTKIIQSQIPKAMQQKNYQIPKELEGHPAVKEVQHRSFRIWVPCPLPELLKLLEKTTNDQEKIAHLKAEVTDFYRRTAQPGELLSLPYQLIIWQTIFTKTENSSTQENPLSQGLRIQLN